MRWPSWVRYVRQAVRGLARRPAASVGIAATLGLGIACATIAFSIVEALVLRPLPFFEPDRIVSLAERDQPGVSPLDPITYLAVALLLAGGTLLVCYGPARRAARTDPMTALREE